MGIGDWFNDVVDWFDDHVVDPVSGSLPDWAKDYWWVATGPMGWTYGLYFMAKKLTPDISADTKLPKVPSPTYDSNTPGNTISEGVAIPIVYGKCRVAGNVVRTNNQEDYVLLMDVCHSMGEIDSYVETYVNDTVWGDLEGSHSKTHKYGTSTQDKITAYWSGTVTDVIKSCAYRGVAYTHFEFNKGREIGGFPNTSVVVQGRKCEPIGGGAAAFSRNPAVALWDWYRTIEGYTVAELDSDSFSGLSTYCTAVPTGGVLPRYYFDFVFDSNISIHDAKKVIWASFNGRAIHSQGKIKVVWEGAKLTSSHSFTEDNIVQGSFSYAKLKKYNVIRIHYIDSDNDYTKSSIEVRLDSDVQERGEIIYEEQCYYITNSELARRRAQFLYDKYTLTNWSCKLTGFSDSSDLEIYDRVQVTHSLPNPDWNNKDFYIYDKEEDEYGRCTFTLVEYIRSIYHDRIAELYSKEVIRRLPPYWSPTDAAVTVSGTPGLGMYSRVSDAIAALPNSGGKIVIKEGTYNLRAGVSMPEKNVWIEGVTKGAVTLTCSATSPLFVIKDKNSMYKFSNFKVVSSSTGSNPWNNAGKFAYDEGRGFFHISGASPNVDVDGVKFQLNDSGVTYVNVTSGCSYDFGVKAIHHHGWLTVRNCEFDRGIPVYSWAHKNIRIVDNIMTRSRHHAIHAEDAYHDAPYIEISRNSLLDTSSYGIFTIHTAGMIGSMESNFIRYTSGPVWPLTGGAFFGILVSQTRSMFSCSGNNVLINNSTTATAQAGLDMYGIYVYLCNGAIIANNGVSVNVQYNQLVTGIGINSTIEKEGCLVIGNRISLVNANHTSDACVGVYCQGDNNVIDQNIVYMTNNAADIGVYLGPGADYNQGTNNITAGVGTSVDDDGANNSVTAKDR